MKKKPKLPMKRAFWLKNLFLIACLLLTAIPGFSQNKTVTGTVVDATGEALIGASVLQQGTSNGVITGVFLRGHGKTGHQGGQPERHRRTDAR